MLSRTIQHILSLGVFTFSIAACDTFEPKSRAHDCPATLAQCEDDTRPPTRPAEPEADASAPCTDCDAGPIDAGTDPNKPNALYRLDIEARAILADPKRDRLYATVSDSGGRYGNQLVTIDPHERTILHAVRVGFDPTAMAISTDGSTLWVSISSEEAVRRVDLSGEFPEPGVQYPLAARCVVAGKCGAASMVVLGDSNDRLLVSLRNIAPGSSPNASGILELVDGKPRSQQLEYPHAPSQLSLGPSNYVFGNSGGFYVMRVNDDGVVPKEYNGVIDHTLADATYADGLLFTSNGEAVDVSDPENPRLAGKFPIKGLVQPLAGHGEVLMLSTKERLDISGQERLVLDVLSTSTWTSTSKVELTGDPAGLSHYQMHNLVRIGTSLAFLALSAPESKQNVFVLNNVEALAEP